MTDQFTCANCHGTFDKAWSDEEAQAEADEVFGTIDDPVIVCDDCYGPMIDWGRVTGELVRERARLARAAYRQAFADPAAVRAWEAWKDRIGMAYTLWHPPHA